MTNPAIDRVRQDELVSQLRTARRAAGMARSKGNKHREVATRTAVDEAKRALGKRGPVWRNDSAPVLNRLMVRNTSYGSWHAELSATL